MTPQRWSQIKGVFFRARETREEERSAYLASACGDDRELRAEVERLLAKDDGHSLGRPAADLLESIASQLAPGETVGQYRVEAKLGEGGMGAVYRAFDTQLRREVALKVLSGGRLADPESKQRLLHEARAVSALNHQNIVIVHEIGSEAGIDFIAMEFVEGKSLKELIPSKGLPLEKELEYAVQIASGLSKAHATGIIHRDLKPGNIMVTSDGVVKLLDFGLARRVRRAESDTASLTQEGEIAGTPAYMSPEQARGEELDARTDLFSFGVVLYEMATGKQAFSGTTSALIFDAILHQAPVSPVHLNPKCPAELERIINKALEKDPDLRYQSASEMGADLKRLKRDTESERAVAALPERQFPTPAMFRHYTWRGAVALAALAVTVMVTGFASLLWFSRSRSAAPQDELKAVPLTTYLGAQVDPTFSPDGSQVAFSWNGEKEGNFNIYVKLVGSEPPLRLTNNPANEYSPVWSPNGRWIAFWRVLSETKSAVVLTTPIPGPERVLTENYRTNLGSPQLSWSPDSHWLAMRSPEKPGEPPTISLFSLETGEKRTLTSRPAENWLGDGYPAFSPDGRKLAFSRWSAWAISEIYLLDLSPDLKAIGLPKRITFGNWEAEQPAWSSDGKSLIFSANSGAGSGLWRLDVPDAAKPQRLAALGDGIIEPAIARHVNRLAYVHNTWHSSIQRMEIPLAQEGKTKTPEKFINSTRNDEFPQFSPDGRKVAFTSDRSGSWEIWICNADGSDLGQITFLGATRENSIPAWSPDSRRLAFSTNVEGHDEIYVMSASGGNPRRLTFTTHASNPGWSNDGRWILFDDLHGSKVSIYKVPAEGGPTVLVRPDAGFWGPRESRDGQLIYAIGADNATLVRVPAGGGGEQSVVTLASAWDFALAKGGVYFIEKGDPKSLQFLDAASGKTRRIATVDSTPYGLTVSPDGRWMLYTQGAPSQSNLMLVENFH